MGPIHSLRSELAGQCNFCHSKGQNFACVSEHVTDYAETCSVRQFLTHTMSRSHDAKKSSSELFQAARKIRAKKGSLTVRKQLFLELYKLGGSDAYFLRILIAARPIAGIAASSDQAVAGRARQTSPLASSEPKSPRLHQRVVLPGRHGRLWGAQFGRSCSSYESKNVSFVC